jgi:phage-related protein
VASRIRAPHSILASAAFALYINSDISRSMALKRVTFHGDSLERLRDFPEEARREAGHELYQVQNGLDPSEWKPISIIGAGVREIRIRASSGAYRVIYIATFADAVHVLHAFEKKTRKTARQDLELAATRLRQLKRGSP